MVRAYVGTRKVPTGSGKTLSMMYDLRKFILSNHPKVPYKIVSNISFSIEEKKLFGEVVTYKAELIEARDDFFKALATRKDTIFLVDEMSVWADQYEWNNVPKVFYSRIKQLRKANIHMMYTVQHFSMVAPRLQKFTEAIVECTPFLKPDIESFAPPPRPIWISQKWLTPDYYDNLDAILKDPKIEKEFIYKKKRIFLSELKRTFPTFDTLNIVE